MGHDKDLIQWDWGQTGAEELRSYIIKIVNQNMRSNWI